MTVQRQAWYVLILLSMLVAACGGSGDDSKPSVKILSPLDQHTAALGEILRVESRAKDDSGISRIELRVNDVQVSIYNVPAGEKSFRVEQSWLPRELGSYSIAVIAYDNEDQASDPDVINVHVQPAPTPSPTPPPTAIPISTSTPDHGYQQPGGCNFNSVFVSDVTIPDGTEMAPGTEFIKTWRMRNSGTCDWVAGFQLVFIEGDRLGGTDRVDVRPTPVNDTVDIEVPFTAPAEPGIYRSTWRMRTPDGQGFGDNPYLQITVSPSITSTPTVTPTATALPLPDLDVSLVSGDLELLVGEPLALQVTVGNYGAGATTQPALVRVALGEGLVSESNVPTLPPNGEVVASLSHVFNEPLDLNVLIVVDPDDEIVETDEENNTAQVRLVVDPPVYVTRTITATPGLRLDLDDLSNEEDRQDIEWQTAEGTVYLGPVNGASAAPLNGAVDTISYVLITGLNWQSEPLALFDMTDGTVFGFRTSDQRIGYARVDEILDDARTSARLTYLIWDWP